ncbi:hypothetical protein SARC_00367 [Sphaeroforma arctica JP610]|uniref:Uncharacterized protein n=1 Tax=Sphaeroforma arctica JP610 TaxID=667725 RepID=A0A0L0GGS2_9EUKA|nr:hypothetical protein SARC_00367 [Sphaeroforma arctica JP610]KNC87543.1 hypothetical protein SARC_00367 [Sphaeroforma arctica JP610]|eukprot:XP_014161445.1 hypothetical protein SARC_00367 [Sphaeroforma arctica JP610]
MNGTSLMMEDMENDLIVQENRSPGRARQQSKKFDLRRISKSIIISKSKRRMLYILLATAVMLFLVAGGTTAIVVVNDDDTTDASHAQAAQGADTADS